MTHHCHATDCDEVVPPSMFMCKRHWYTLPKPMRDAIWATYRPGQERSKDPSSAYLHNARTAIDWLADYELSNSLDGPSFQMPAITLWQPWASLVAAGAKRFEFRSWRAPARHVGHRIAIHAGARKMNVQKVRDLYDRLDADGAPELGLLATIAMTVLRAAIDNPATVPHSAIVCSALLGEPIRNAALAAALGLDADDFLNDSDRDEHSNYGWPLTDIRPCLPPVPQRGAMGFWTARMPMEGAR